MSDLVDITGLDKADVLVALFDASSPQGLGFFAAAISSGLTLDIARRLVQERTYFDYLQGRVLKVDLRGDAVDPVLFDRDNGRGACAAAIARLRAKAKEAQP